MTIEWAIAFFTMVVDLEEKVHKFSFFSVFFWRKEGRGRERKKASREPLVFFFVFLFSASPHLHVKMALGSLARATSARLLSSMQMATSSSTTTAAAALAASSQRAFSASAAAASDEPLIEHEVRKKSPIG